MHFMAHHDPLTGLPNRSFFKEKLSQTLHQARMNRQHVVLAYVDLDNFKRINDSLGHGAGDELLRQIAGRMLEFTRASDLVVRLGGDEFVLVFANQSRGEGDILPRLHQLRASLSRPMAIAGMTVSATCSMGIATFPEDGETIDALLANADAAMYRAKQLGRDGLQVFNGKETPAAIAAGDRLEELRSAIAGDQLYLDYQPQIDAGTGRILGVEALVRWNHPELGVQPPGHFIPLAEATGLILPLGLWVLKTACRQNKAWQVLGLPPVIIAVNVSPRQFCDPALVGQVRQALNETGLDPRYLELELTENAVMQDTDSALATIFAGDGDNPESPGVRSRRGKTHIGGDAIHRQAAAAVDDHGDLRTQPSRQAGRFGRRSDPLDQGAGIGDLMRIETRQRSGLDRNAVAHGNAERIDLRREQGSAFCGQAANLQAAAGGDLDDAVAMAQGRFAESDQGFGRQTSSDGVEPRQQPVTGLHGCLEGRACATAKLSGHAATSRARASSISAARSSSTALRSGCQRPRRRADWSRSAMTMAAAGFSRKMKSRTAGSPT